MWRSEGWENPIPVIEPVPENLSAENAYVKHFLFEAGADAMHKADVAWLIERITHDDRGYVFKMTDKEWQEFIK